MRLPEDNLVGTDAEHPRQFGELRRGWVLLPMLPPINGVGRNLEAISQLALGEPSRLAQLANGRHAMCLTVTQSQTGDRDKYTTRVLHH